MTSTEKPAVVVEEAEREPRPSVLSRLRAIDDRRLELVAIGVVLFFVLLPLRGLLRTQGPPMEEGFMLVFPEMVLDGKVPNRDFLHLYGPGSLWALAAVYKVFGTTLEIQRLFGLVQQLGFAFGIYLLARPWGRSAAAPCAVIALVAMLAASGLVALAWVGALALGLLGIWAGLRASAADDPRRGRRNAIASGALLGAALLFRPDLALGVGLGGFVVFRGLDRSLRRPLLIGFGVAVSPYLVHVAMAGLGNVVNGLLIEPVFKLRGGRRLPIPPSRDSFAGWNQGFADLTPFPWPATLFRGPMQLRIWFFALPAIVAFLVVMGGRRLRSEPASLRARTLMAVAAFSAGILPQAIQRADSTHLAWAGAVPIAFLPIALVEVLRERPRALWARNLVAAGSVVLAVFLFIPHFLLRNYVDYVAQTFDRHRIVNTIDVDGRRFYYGRPDTIAAVKEMLPDLERWGRPGDRLVVGNVDLRKTPYSDAWIYYILPEFEPATHYIEMDPGVANAEDSGLADDIAAADLVILTSTYDGWDEPNDSAKLGSEEPVEVLHEQFCHVGLYQADMQLWVRCALLDEDRNRLQP